ncbi:MAG TPA: HD domain-containing phosphohydrolase, partial [Nevskiaceae bacterium]|nr:HD domain-containing phosphohydrolase [Nevskiaceae bacterium]
MNASLPTVLVVDDTPQNLNVASRILREQYRALVALDGTRALEIARASPPPDLILLDVMMPGMNGYEVCRQLKADARTRDIPVIFLTALDEANSEAAGFEAGAVDYITKPISPPTMLARVRTHLRLRAHERHLADLVHERTRALEQRTRELEQTRLEVIRRLGRAAEYKDDATGLHVIRMSHYTRLLALAAGMSSDRAELLFHAAPMHDIGKIGIPDHILQKPGALTDEEWVVMKQHPAIGAGIIGLQHGELLETARLVALTHHEKWDGSGYPRARAGKDIPVEGRIVAVADVFDALTSKRPYKNAWSVE